MSTIRTKAESIAREFVEREKQFHLGFLPTEQPHPYTADFSETVTRDPAEGVRVLLSVDNELPPVARRVLAAGEYDILVNAYRRVVREKRSVCFSGCGSTGRLAMMLEEMWRGFWEELAGVSPGDAERRPDKNAAKPNSPASYDTGAAIDASSSITVEALAAARRSSSIITGGDRALIRSVENFEDFSPFGAQQMADLDLRKGDLLIAVSEGGETSSVIGTIEEGLRRGCQVVFAYNNPTELLVEHIERSRSVIDDPRVTTLDLYSGSMALTGSTRMQATTLEMFILGAAMEEALLLETDDEFTPDRQGALYVFGRLIASLQESENRAVLGRLASHEAQMYTRGGRITYYAERFLLDIFSDTTERTPTFMLPPFRRSDDPAEPPSWAYAKDPVRESEAAWFAMLRRKPRGLNWSAELYRDLNAPESISANPPVLNDAEISRYLIGCEDDPSRYRDIPHTCFSVVIDTFTESDDTGQQRTLRAKPPGCTKDSLQIIAIIPGVRRNSGEQPDGTVWKNAIPADGYQDGKVPKGAGPAAELNNGTVVNLLTPDIAESPIYLFHHLAVKLVFNTISTASMGIMGRIRRNWMVQVDPTNKKLIDRASRIISTLSGVSYEVACTELHVVLLDRQSAPDDDVSRFTSPVVTVLERLGKR